MSLIRQRLAVGLCLWLLLCFSGYWFADEVRGRVVSVADGDTLTVLDTNNRQHRVRLNGVTCLTSVFPSSVVGQT